MCSNVTHCFYTGVRLGTRGVAIEKCKLKKEKVFFVISWLLFVCLFVILNGNNIEGL